MQPMTREGRQTFAPGPADDWGESRDVVAEVRAGRWMAAAALSTQPARRTPLIAADKGP